MFSTEAMNPYPPLLDKSRLAPGGPAKKCVTCVPELLI